jgi:biotin synthase
VHYVLFVTFYIDDKILLDYNVNMRNITELIDILSERHILSYEEYLEIISNASESQKDYLFSRAEEIRKKIYGTDIYIRGLIEFTNYCKNDCFYCGIRSSNKKCERYRLTKEDIISCCSTGYDIGYRTFVLQGGEDPFFSSDDMADLIDCIKKKFPDCALTLSFGEYTYETYKKWKDAGADRYLLRHETSDKTHYNKLHPKKMSFDNRIRCLNDLKALGYQVGCGFMVGSPFQTCEHLAAEMIFLNKFQPDMVGIGPFIVQKDTPFGNMKSGTLEQTLIMLALIRLTLPDVLLPATTALATIDPFGRELGIKAGANVCMPNLSPVSVRKKYALYDNKKSADEEAAEYTQQLSERMRKIGYNIVTDRGDRKHANIEQ